MAGSIQELRAAARAFFQGVEAWLDFESSVAEALTMALACVNKDVPRYRVINFTGTGVQTYTLVDQDDDNGYWDPESSTVKSVEYPVGEIPRSYLENDEFFVYEDHLGVVTINFVDYSIPAATAFRVLITSQHTFDDEESTLGSQAYSALKAKVFELLCKMLEARLNYTAMPEIDADTVTFNDKPRNMKFTAQYWEKEYNSFAGKDDDVKAAHAMADADAGVTGGADYVWHGRRSR